MDYFVLDTSAIVHVLRNTVNGKALNSYLDEYPEDYSLLISVATVGELDSLKLQQKWSESRCLNLEKFLNDITIINIENADKALIDNYAMLDAFSLRKIPDKSGDLKYGSAIGMGKNDLWIAATAVTMDATLITSDGDFDHLHDIFLKVIKF